MSGNQINRRDFLKIMGWGGAGAALAGCDRPSTVTLEEGKEDVAAYLIPEEFVIPGTGMYYASTCQQCAAGCGVHGRVREGRVLKLEGNPDSPVNYGKLCQMGQGGVQAHYNPDRITKPMVRKGGSLAEASWDEALGLIKEKTAGVSGDRFAWVTGAVSGHQAALLAAHLESAGSKNHYVHEIINNAVGQALNRDALGDARPTYHLDQAKVVLSLGADFLGAWQSPVHFSTQYAKFRSGDRGVLVVAEPSMSLTGASADMWMAVQPGTEAVLALGIANALLAQGAGDMSAVPASVKDLVTRHDVATVSRITGVAGDRINKVAGWLKSRSPSLVLVGAPAEGQEHGYEAAAAGMLLNVMLGNIGKTIVSGGEFPFPQLQAKSGGTKDLVAFADALDKQGFDAVFFYGANPVYTAPGYLGLADKLAKVPFKLVFGHFLDETAAKADVVLPLHSFLEDWGTHVPAYQAAQAGISMQQPLMDPIHAGTRGFGDLMIELLKARDSAKYGQYADYYAYLQNAFAAMPASVRQNAASNDVFWRQVLQKGLVPVATAGRAIKPQVVEFTVPEYQKNSQYPYHLVPAARLGMWDGRHANIPWLQEAPDQITKVVWDSWAEVHPKTAGAMGLVEGDVIRITSDQGAIEAKVYIYKGVHPDVVAVPMGRGHEEYGRYAKGRGVNPLKILSPVTDRKTGELALYGTRVKIEKVGHQKLVRLGGSETQVGRKLVATITADVFRRTEGGQDVA